MLSEACFTLRGSALFLDSLRGKEKLVNVWVCSLFFFKFTLQLNMVRQRKDGDSLERTDGSKPTWKVFLAVWLFFCSVLYLMSAYSVCPSGCQSLSLPLSVFLPQINTCTHTHITRDSLMELNVPWILYVILMRFKLLLFIWALSYMVWGQPCINKQTLCNCVCVWVHPQGVTNLPVIKLQSLFVFKWKLPSSERAGSRGGAAQGPLTLAPISLA